jgi:hypothetical protein
MTWDPHAQIDGSPSRPPTSGPSPRPAPIPSPGYRPQHVFHRRHSYCLIAVNLAATGRPTATSDVQLIPPGYRPASRPGSRNPTPLATDWQHYACRAQTRAPRRYMPDWTSSTTLHIGPWLRLRPWFSARPTRTNSTGSRCLAPAGGLVDFVPMAASARPCRGGFRPVERAHHHVYGRLERTGLASVAFRVRWHR